jgi:hypothetical protein
MRRLRSAAAAVVAAGVLAAPGPAAAHEEIEPSTIPTGTPVFLTLSAANEKAADLIKVTVAPPEGLTMGETTKEPPGWTVTRSPSAVTWAGGSVAPDHFEQWGFEIEGADQPGTLTWTVTMAFADGSSEQARVAVTAGGGSAAMSAPTTTVTPAAGHPGSSSADSGAQGRANLALVLALVAALAALGALVRAGTAGRGRRAAAPADAQDW